MIVQELSHPLGGYQFPDIEYLFKAPVKSVIYCNTIDLGFRVACFGWSLPCALGTHRLHNVRLWSALTSAESNERTLELFKNNPSTTTIVATMVSTRPTERTRRPRSHSGSFWNIRGDRLYYIQFWLKCYGESNSV